MIFFWIYDVCRIFFNITLELLYVFRNTEYNVSKYANFSLYRFINYCEFKIIIAFENRFQTMYIQARSWGGGGGTSEPPRGIRGNAPPENFEN